MIGVTEREIVKEIEDIEKMTADMIDDVMDICDMNLLVMVVLLHLVINPMAAIHIGQTVTEIVICHLHLEGIFHITKENA
jgi:hypothetical protein